MKHMNRNILALTVCATLLLSSCSPRYLIRPSGEKIVEIGDTDYSFEDSATCRLESAYVDERLENSLLRVRVKNTTKSAFSIDQSQFRLEGTPFSETLVQASVADIHRQKLVKQSELIDKQLKSPQWDGVSDIHTYLGAEQKSDETISKSKSDFKKNEDYRKLQTERMARLKREAELLKTGTLSKTEIAPGATIEGLLVFETRITKEGDIRLILDSPQCTLSTALEVRMTKGSIF